MNNESSTNSRLLKISSNDRSAESSSRYQIIYHTNDYDLHQIKKIVLKTALIPNTQYNLNTHNNVLNLPNTISGPLYTVPVGQYSVSTLITALQGLVSGLTITQDPTTLKLTLAMAGGTFDVLTTANPMAKTLGILTTAATQTSHACVGLPDLVGLKNVYISTQALSNHTSMITSDKKQNVFCNVGIDVEFGAVKVLEEDGDSLDFAVYHSQKNISTIDITLLDENSNVVDLNGADWHLIFRVYT
jgi:hypothetical protein